MSINKLLFLGSIAIILSGCQSWQRQDLNRLPPTASAARYSQPGIVQVRYWDNVDGISVSDLTELEAYPDNPDEVADLTELKGPTNRANYYGSLVRGYIVPTTDGPYTFFVSGDHRAEFWLSPSEDPKAAEMIALAPGVTKSNDYDKYESQTSPTMELSAGKRYYFEIRHKEAWGSDHFNVAWQGPDFSRQIIGSGFIASLGPAPSTETADRGAIEEAYSQGYRVGYLDGSEGLEFTPDYPMLDEDQDNLYDNWEVIHGLDPTNPEDAASDPDNDLLNGTDEFLIGTEENNTDSDGDGIPDGVEFAYNLKPLDASDATKDLDGDGISNLQEYQANTPIDSGEPATSTESETLSEEPAAPQVTLSWTAPLTRTDGSSMSLGQIDHYEIVYGQSPDNLNQTVRAAGDATRAEIGELAPGTWYFSIRVVDTNGQESSLSEPIEHTVK